MSSAALLRPGIAIGGYPQRPDLRDSWLERTASNITGQIKQSIYGRKPNYQRFVDQVNHKAQGLDELNEFELKQRVRDLRRSLYSKGIKDELVTTSFALIRELASRRLKMRHHDVQLFGGWVMLRGMIAEMETGEGKTLTATLSASTAALAGIPVHIVTVNDFLVARDADWMGPLYRALGLSVGIITEEMTPDERRNAYACDITYCTNKQLVFDYLKDRILLKQENRRLHLQLEGLYNDRPRTSQLLMRGLCFAIVDEADSVLVDEARTPLIISNASNNNQQQEMIYQQAINIAKKLTSPRDFNIKSGERRVDFTDLGKGHINKLSRSYGGLWSGARRREELIRQALTALHLFHLDKHYLIREGKVQIIDEYTGRVMADRTWERGLHQMIETKEGCSISETKETLARISYQKFFRRYLRLAGMTGTAREVANELWAVYRLNVVTVPTNRPMQRTVIKETVYTTDQKKWRVIIKRVKELHKEKRPVLIGTRSVGASEHLSKLLFASGLMHQVLNARQDQEEAQIIAQAGQSGRITVATNMAGRGTDIRLSKDVVNRGGLYVLATERNDSGRIDRQLFGRCGRQGDPGSYQAIVSIEDDLIEDFFGEKVCQYGSRWFNAEKPLPRWFSLLVVKISQISTERKHSHMRKELLKHDDSLGDLLSFSGRGE